MEKGNFINGFHKKAININTSFKIQEAEKVLICHGTLTVEDYFRFIKTFALIINLCFGKYKTEECFLSFNGGKDCTVLLHVVCNIYKQRTSDKLLCLYVQQEDPFSEVESFIKECEELYNIEIYRVKNDIKTALEDTLKAKPHLKACFLGSRRTDPHCEKLQPMQMTDPNWPQVLRVSPILDWSLADVWNYIEEFKIPYCKLYDLGYTSLGNRNNTTPNSKLKYIDANGVIKYNPAHTLRDADEFEREGRE